jgi:hypothetical protein
MPPRPLTTTHSATAPRPPDDAADITSTNEGEPKNGCRQRLEGYLSYQQRFALAVAWSGTFSQKMTRYKALLHGKNFLIDLGKGLSKHGFYTPRYTNAESESEADQAFIDEFRASSKAQNLRESMMNSSDDPPRITIEEICPCPDDEDFESGVAPGLAFYSEDEDAAEKTGENKAE